MQKTIQIFDMNTRDQAKAGEETVSDTVIEKVESNLTGHAHRQNVIGRMNPGLRTWHSD